MEKKFSQIFSGVVITTTGIHDEKTTVIANYPRTRGRRWAWLNKSGRGPKFARATVSNNIFSGAATAGCSSHMTNHKNTISSSIRTYVWVGPRHTKYVY